MDNSFNLLLYLDVISIIFIDAKLNTYQMDKFMNGHVISMKRLAGVKPMLPKMVLTNLQF